MFVGSYYGHIGEVTRRITDEDLLKTRDNIGEYYLKEYSFIQNSMIYSVKGHEDEYERGLQQLALKFIDLKGLGLGSVQSILFWNDPQRQVYF